MGYDGCDCGLSADGMLIQTPHRVSRRFRSANLQRDAPTQANCNYSLLLVVNPWYSYQIPINIPFYDYSMGIHKIAQATNNTCWALQGWLPSLLHLRSPQPPGFRRCRQISHSWWAKEYINTNTSRSCQLYKHALTHWPHPAYWWNTRYWF